MTSGAGGRGAGWLVGQDEVTHLRVDGLAPAAAAEDAVMARALHFDMLACLGSDAGTQIMGGPGLAGTRNIVRLAFNRQQGRVPDVLRAHQARACLARS